MRIDMFTSVLLFGIVLTSAGDAQLCGVREYGWTNAVGGEDDDNVLGVVADPSGRVYVTGAFLDRVDFRPDKKRDYHRNKGGYALFLSAYEGEGGYLWTMSLSNSGGYIHGLDLALTPKESIAIAGRFRGKIDFRAGSGRETQRSYDEGTDAFIALYSESGDHEWTRVFRGPGHASSRAIAVDEAGNILAAGDYSNWTDFDPGRREDIHRTNGDGSAFVAKLSASGSYIWARSFPGDATDVGEGLATGPSGEVVAVGIFRGETDFDPGEGRDMRRTAGEDDVFVVKLNADGDLEWVYTIGGVGYDFARDVAIDDDGNAYVVGSFRFTVDFDPKGQGDVREALEFDGYVLKLAADGDVVWVRVIAGSGSAFPEGVALRPDGLLATTGSFTGLSDFDPGEGVDERTGRTDVFITLLSTDGEYIGSDVLGGSESEKGRRAAFDPEGNLLVAGTFSSLDCDFDPTTGVDIRSAVTDDDPDIFTTKLYCGSCQYVERHTIELKKQRTLKAEVRALVPGGRATVECTPTDPPGEPIETRVNINGDNTGKYKLKKLDKGEYACAVTQVRDSDGNVVCDEPAGKRVVNVK